MNIKHFIFSIFVLVFFQNHSFCQSEYGVWANKDCELLKTKNSTLFFERIGKDYQIKFMQIERINENNICKHYGEIHFTDTIKTFEYLAFDIDSMLTKEDIGFLENKNLIIKGKFGSQKLDLIEKIEIVKPYEMIYAISDSIGSCLQSWFLGTSLELNKENSLFRFMAGTNKHSFMFDIQKGFTYCRAARIRSNNNGTFMAQNIRLYDDGKYKAAIMKEDNLIESSQILEINNELFNPNACYYVPNGFYWSLVDFTQDVITLNGCQNKYKFARPNMHSKRLKEWIKFEKY